MSFATANRAGLYSVKEVTWGTTPATPALASIRYTGENIDESLSFEKSKEIRADRMLADTILVDSEPAGSFNFEMSATSFDAYFEGAMMSTWSAALAIVGVAGDISTVAAASDNVSSTLAGKFTNIVLGQWIRLSGFVTNSGENNGFYRVTGITSNQLITVVPQPPSAETPAGAAAHIDGQYVRNGITEHSWTFVKILADATVSTRHVFRGMRIKGFSLEMSTGSILTGAFNLMGKSGELTTAAFAGETYPAGTTTDVMNAVTNVQNIVQDDASPGAPGSVMSLNFELDNQHRAQKGIGILGNVGVVGSQLMVNCTAQQYFESKTQADKFKATTAFSFAFRLEDVAGNAYIVTLPRCKYESFIFNSTGLDTDVMADTQFTALRDATTNCMVQIDKFAA